MCKIITLQGCSEGVCRCQKTILILPKCIKNNLRRPEIQHFPGGHVLRPLLWSHTAHIYAIHVLLETTHMNICLITFFLQYLLLQVNPSLGSNQYTDYIKITTSESNVQCSFFLLWRYNFNDIINQSNTNKRTSFLVFTSTNSVTICFTLSTSPDSVACRNCASLSNTWRRKDLLIAVTLLCSVSPSIITTGRSARFEFCSYVIITINIWAWS